jgi:hypothetical protein
MLPSAQFWKCANSWRRNWRNRYQFENGVVFGFQTNYSTRHKASMDAKQTFTYRPLEKSGNRLDVASIPIKS